jgi:hypothetical protein
VQNTQVSETKEFRKSFWHENRRIDAFESQLEIDILCYRGSSPNPAWTDVDPGRLLFYLLHKSLNNRPKGMYSKLCTIMTDTSEIQHVIRRCVRQDGQTYYVMDYDIVLSFGLTELTAQVAWKENVRFSYLLRLPVINFNLHRPRGMKDGKHEQVNVEFRRDSFLRSVVLLKSYTTMTF